MAKVSVPSVFIMSYYSAPPAIIYFDIHFSSKADYSIELQSGLQLYHHNLPLGRWNYFLFDLHFFFLLILLTDDLEVEVLIAGFA